jgi:excinuclease ABC subunit C
MDKKEILKEKLTRLPDSAGIYMFKNADEKIIYIGKAKNLKKRIHSYFRKNLPDIKTKRLVSNITDLEFTVVDSEIEAFILEANLIRKHRPRYNITLKDNKRYPYIKITDEPYPRILITRHKNHDKAEYFGPFTDVSNMRRVYETVNAHFSLRLCNQDVPVKSCRPCLYYDMGRCHAPCSGNVPENVYEELVDEVRMFLRGRRTELVKRLKERMEKEAEELNFERAKVIRDAINAVEIVLKPQKIEHGLQNRDIIGAAIGKTAAAFSVFRIREGAMTASHKFDATVEPDTSLKGALSEFLNRFYTEFADIPPEIMLQVTPDDKGELEGYITTLSGRKVSILTPKRGIALGLLKLSRQNARLELVEVMAQREKHHLPYPIHSLQKDLGLSKLPRRIEAFDISNLGEKSRVASMVQFIDGQPKRDGFRRFRIKLVEGQDDPACIHEAVKRRLARLIDEHLNMPDLILIDGGKTQLGAAIDALKELDQIDKIDIISLAKRFEEVHSPQFPDPVGLPKDSASIKLLQRIRDAAHKYAIEYHRALRDNASMSSLLEEISGIGKRRREALLSSFKTLTDIKDAKEEEIAKKGMMPLIMAKRLKEHLTTILALLIIVFGIVSCTPKPRFYSDFGKIKKETTQTRQKQKQADSLYSNRRPTKRRDKPLFRTPY